MNSGNANSKVAAVVVTFNRKALLLECLNALLKQTYPVDRIYLVDNASTDGTPDALAEAGFIGHAKIEYVRLPENSGGAGGFYEGMRLARQGAFDWVWVMDDDAEPMPDALSVLLLSNPPRELGHYSALCGVKIGLDGLPQYVHRGRFDPGVGPVPLVTTEATTEQTISYASFVGLLINTKAVDKVGYPLPEFFIWFDDVEYCQRLNRVGPIYYNPKSVILHKDNVLMAKEARGGLWARIRNYKKTPISIQWKMLCGFRNYVYVMRVHGSWGFGRSVRYLARALVKVIFFERGGSFLAKNYISYWLQGAGFKPYATIKPAEWSRLIAR